MVEKITISPSEVRGYGDIVSPKTTEDFTNYMSGLTESDGVYTLVYDETGTYLNLSASPTTVSYGGSVVFTAVLTQTGEPVEGETVSFYEGETLLGSDTTDSNGEATLTKSDFTVGSHSVKAVYDEVESSAVSVSVTKLAVTVSLSAEQSSIEYGANAVLNGVLSLGSGVTVTFYEGSTSLGTVTTSTGGAFSKTITSPSRGSHTYRVEYSGDSTHESASASVNVSVNKITSTITLAASTGTITYGQSVTLSGTVSVGSGASIKIYNGSTLVDTVTSGSGGAFLKSVSGLNAGSHTFKAVYDGDDTHEGVTSSNVSVTVNKATPTITFASDKSVVTYGDSFTLSGVLSAGSGVTIRIIKNQSPFPLAELTTGAGGAYSKTIDGLAVGTYNLFATSVADSNYNSVTSSTITVTVTDTPTPVPASIDLTGTKSILSYADSESSVLTATVLDSSDNPVQGVDVNLYNGSTLWDTLTTDSSGECSKTYSSAGVGDITFTAEVDGTLLTKTYAVQDYQYYANSMQKIKDTFINDTSVSGRTIYESRFTFNSDVEIEFKLKNIPNSWLIGFGSDGTSWNSKAVWFKIQNYNQNKASIMYADTGGTVRDVGITTSYDTSTVFKIKSENIHKIYWYLNGAVQGSRDTRTTIPLGLRVDIFDNQDYDIEYIKVKKL